MRFILFLSVLLLNISINAKTYAQNPEPQSTPIQKQDIIGTWRVIAFFPGTFGEKYPDSDLLTPSQIYGFYESNHLRSIVSDKNKTFTYNLQELENRFGDRPKNIKYSFIRDGLVAITTDDKRETGILWQVHRTNEAGEISGLQTQKDDLIMGMTPEKMSKTDDFRYIRILRKIQ